MKRILIILFTLSVMSSINGQNSYLGINLGLSIPGTEFAGSQDLFSDGFAVSGFSIEFDGIYFPGSVFGFGAMMGFGSYYTLQDKYFDRLVSYLDSHSDNPGFDIPDRSEVLFESGFWSIFNLLAGPELSVPIRNFQFGVRAMAGPTVILAPGKIVSYESGLEKMLVETGGTDLSFSYIYGTSLMYFMSPGTSIRVAADYLTGVSDYNFEAFIETPLGVLEENRSERIKIKTLQMSVGLSYAF